MRIAVVGTGISGLTAAWLLQRRHEVHVFEREPRLGGHTHTAEVVGGSARTSAANRGGPGAAAGGGSSPGPGLPVDTGFIVYNEATYPYLTRLFDELEVATEASDMSWGLTCRRCDLEYAGTPRGLAAQPRNLLDPGYLGFLRDILRFHHLGRRLVDDPRTRQVPLGRFLRGSGLGPAFARHYLLPMAGAIWSTGPGTVEDFPLHTLLTFFRNHGLLGVTTHHPWRTVSGGASSYIPRLTAGYRDRLHVGDGVTTVVRDGDGVELTLDSGARHRFDRVVIAAHADEALGMLADPTVAEKELLGTWEYTPNAAWLHRDARLLPRAPAARASWNYLLEDCRTPGERVSLSYHMNRLQNLDVADDWIVTLNPAEPPRGDRVALRATYTHPAYTADAVATQDRLDELNGPRHTFFVGAYQRYGFHEDGVWSAVRAAGHLGVRWPA